MSNNSLTLVELVEKLKNEQLLKRDLVVPSSCLRFENGHLIISNVSANPKMDELLNSTGVTFSSDNLTTLSLSPIGSFHRQVAGRFDIPYTYYERMLSESNISLLDANVNHWLSTANKNYLVRCFAGQDGEKGVVRALLGDRYRILDNLDVLMAALDAVKQSGVNIKIESADITDTKMYVRFIAPDVVQDSPELLKRYRVPKSGNTGDNGIHAGFVLTNSETGHGSSYIAPRLVVSACTNGMIMKQDSMNKVHLGSKMEEGAFVWSEETKQKNIELIIAQVKDAVARYTSNDYLGEAIGKLEENGSRKLEHPIDAIANVSKDLAFSEQKQKDILSFFMESADNTAFGLAQAVTFYAHDKADADDQFEMESVAVDIVSNIERYDRPVVVKEKRTTQKAFSRN